MSITEQIEEIQVLTQELTEAENDYMTAKDEVAAIWKKYFHWNPIKKAANARRKAAKAALDAKLESMSELKALLKSMK